MESWPWIMKGSTALTQDMTEKWDEAAFQRLRREQDDSLLYALNAIAIRCSCSSS